MPERRRDVARLCANLVPLRRAAPEDTERLLVAARAGQEIGVALSDLLRRLDAPDRTRLPSIGRVSPIAF